MSAGATASTAERPYRHALIVGGTGMLAGASVALAGRSARLSSVARTPRSLDALDAAVRGSGCVHHVLALDWSDPDAFLHAIDAHLDATEPPDLVVAWIHDDVLGVRLARMLDRGDRPVDVVQVIGSARGDALAAADAARRDVAATASAGSSLTYRQVVLGARRTGAGVRWLTHDEIAEGVLAAIEGGELTTVVGEIGAHG